MISTDSTVSSRILEEICSLNEQHAEAFLRFNVEEHKPKQIAQRLVQRLSAEQTQIVHDEIRASRERKATYRIELTAIQREQSEKIADFIEVGGSLSSLAEALYPENPEHQARWLDAHRPH